MPRKAKVTEEEVGVKETEVKEVEETTQEKEVLEPLTDGDEIEVVALIPNVTYLDSEMNDMYRWENVGDTEVMEFGVIKKMWRNHKSYFNKLWLKPLDERVMKKFGLNKLYEKYDYLLDADNYSYKNITEITKAIDSLNNALKYTISTKILDFVTEGVISDIKVIKALERKLNMDLVEMI